MKINFLASLIKYIMGLIEGSVKDAQAAAWNPSILFI